MARAAAEGLSPRLARPVPLAVAGLLPGEEPVLRRAPAAAAVAALALLAPRGAGDARPARAPERRESVRLLFTGDVLLARQVSREVDASGGSPWDALAAELGKADLVAGNLEGAVGDPSGCAPARDASPCFDVPRRHVPLLSRAGFTHLSLENNHAADLGEAGRAATRAALSEEGLAPVDFERSPLFVRLGERTVALVALSTVGGRDSRAAAIPSPELRQKLRLASRLAEAVVVLVHWGEQLLDWPSEAQRRQAGWLVANGASLVVGHHPHVVQPPACVGSRPVFYSLGNHLFDQKYPETRRGLVADCTLDASGLRCSAFATEAPAGTFFPRRSAGGDVAAPLAACPVPLAPPLRLAGRTFRPLPLGEGTLSLEAREGARVVFRTRPARLLSVEAGELAGPGSPPLLLALERHASPIDGEEGVRPYVREMGPRGLVDRWRGSALAWPLVDATLLPSGLLCALHRGDSFVTLGTDAARPRTAVYRWNGFGFSAGGDAGDGAACRAAFELEAPAALAFPAAP